MFSYYAKHRPRNRDERPLSTPRDHARFATNKASTRLTLLACVIPPNNGKARVIPVPSIAILKATTLSALPTGTRTQCGLI